MTVKGVVSRVMIFGCQVLYSWRCLLVLVFCILSTVQLLLAFTWQAFCLMTCERLFSH